MYAIKRKDGLYYAGLNRWTNRKAERLTYGLRSDLPGTIGPATLIDSKTYRVSPIMIAAHVVEV